MIADQLFGDVLSYRMVGRLESVARISYRSGQRENRRRVCNWSTDEDAGARVAD